jgi:excisionase family DNA binding protein
VVLLTEERLFSKSDAASYLGISERTLDRWIEQGKLKVTRRLGKSPRWSREELDAAITVEQPEES